MGLSSDLISQFSKATVNHNKEKKESIVYGTAVEYAGSMYVRLDGSSLMTPMESTTDVKAGDRVTVLIKNHTATTIGNITSPSVSNSRLESAKQEVIAASKIYVTEELKAYSGVFEKIEVFEGKFDSIEASVGEFDRLKANLITTEILQTNYIDAINAKFNNLNATYATITQLNAVNAKIENLNVDELVANNAVIKDLTADIAKIDTLIFGTASGNVIQTQFSNSVIAQLGDAQIKSAMIDSISASKITAGDIITNNVRVKSEDGSLLISDETIQISDDTRVRVQIGKDASNDYSINIWDQNGNLMFSEGGITDSAIKDKIIRNDMVSENANISASKLDIDSLFTEINGSTKTIKSTRVYLDEEGQSLDVSFKQMSTNVEGLSNNVSSQGTQISAIQGQISSKIWQQDINEVTGELSTKYSTLSQSLEGFKTTVSNTYSTKTDLNALNNRVGTAETNINQNATALTLQATDISNLGTRVTAVEVTASGLTSSVTGLDGRLSTVEQTATNFTIRLNTTDENVAAAAAVANSVKTDLANNYAKKTLPDTRNDNQSPIWYIQNYPSQIITEFKSSSAIGLSGETYCTLTTTVPWADPSGGYPKQNAKVNNKEYWRVGTNDTTWSAWTDAYGTASSASTAAGNAQSTANTANSTANSALTKANSASTAASNAQNTANAANTAAGNAQSTANTARTEAANAAKTATNYLNFSNNGLVVGNLTASTLGNNILIDTSSINIRNGTNVLAYFTADEISIGSASERSTITLCDIGTIQALSTASLYDTLWIHAECIDLTADKSLYVNSASDGGNGILSIITQSGWSSTAMQSGYSDTSTDDIIHASVQTYSGATGGAYVALSAYKNGVTSSLDISTSSVILTSAESVSIAAQATYGEVNISGRAVNIGGTLNVTGNAEIKNSILRIADGDSYGIDFYSTASSSYVKAIHMDASGNIGIGLDLYNITKKSLYLYGNDLNIKIAQAGNVQYRPYYRAGDSITLTGASSFKGAGYLTSSKTQVTFLVPLVKPIIGSPTVTVSTLSGFVLRQGNAYTHGSSDSVYAKPDSYSTAILPNVGVVIAATFSTTTNATNNDSIGILWSGKIVFS